MARTRKRALVSGAVSGRNALSYAGILGILGFVILVGFTNFLVFIIGLVAFVMYVAVYGYYKRRSSYGTLVGSIPGALPPVAGYVAVTDRFDVGTLLLFLVLVYWQMAHFYAIALYRLKDYQSAEIPVMPAVSGSKSTKQQILLYIVAFMLINVAFTILGYTGATFATIMTIVGLIWLWVGAGRLKGLSDIVWGRSMFLFSLIVILTLSVMLAIGGRLD
ncbi:MAG: Protoheme farnesyltransferase, partial [Candidatus Saccharibacteria bacterium]|nr:Protoheme farnesyltransferase [Candidatus Saccharibacteria bacterium]